MFKRGTMARRKARAEHYVNNKEFLAALVKLREDREIAEINPDKPSLLPIQDAYRFQTIQSMKNDGTSLIRGQNPAYGANLDFFLPDANNKLVSFSIQDEKGKEKMACGMPPTFNFKSILLNLFYVSRTKYVY